MNSVFERYQPGDLTDLIAGYPLAWVAPRGGGAGPSVLLPLIAERGPDGEIARLIGHMSRANPLKAALETEARATILFQGPHGYISPTLAGSRSWAPTWNYAQVRIEAEMDFESDGIDAALEVLVTHMERDQAEPWRAREVGDRYASLAARVIAFSARPMAVHATFKLGQDESPEVLARILDGLGDTDLARWMRRFNAERLAG